MSKAGNETLAKSVVRALLQYTMSIFKAPISMCRAIEQRISSFWWKHNEAKLEMHWKKWEILKNRKDSDGMGFRDLVTFNKVMLGKQVWRMAQNPMALWCQIFKGLYFPNGEFWKARKGTRLSWGWQSFC